MTHCYIAIMAGGSGTRMGMSIPKQLLLVGKKPMIVHLLNNAALIDIDVFLILSNQNKQIIIQTLVNEKYLNPKDQDQDQDQDKSDYNHSIFRFKNINVYISIQPIANGTGGAMMALRDTMEKLNLDDNLNDSSILCLSADVPLISKKTMKKTLEQLNQHTMCVILAKNTKDNFGYGRIVLKNGEFTNIVEQKDCSEEEKQIELINTGVYGFKFGALVKSLKYLNQNNSQKEYYLTDCPKIIRYNEGNGSINVIQVNHTNQNDQLNYDETMGANTVEQLQILRNEYNKKFVIQSIQDSDENLEEYNLKNLIRVLDQLSITDVTDLNQLVQHIRDNSCAKINKKHILVAKFEDQIIGTGSIIIENKIIHNMGKTGHIEDVVVDNEYRGHGLAKIIMEYLINIAKINGCYKVILDASDNVKVFYQNIGFKVHANNMRLSLL